MVLFTGNRSHDIMSKSEGSQSSATDIAGLGESKTEIGGTQSWRESKTGIMPLAIRGVVGVTQSKDIPHHHFIVAQEYSRLPS